MSADIIPFRSRFDLDSEQAVARMLFGNGESDGGRARLKRRIAKRKAESLDKSTADDTRPSELV